MNDEHEMKLDSHKRRGISVPKRIIRVPHLTRWGFSSSIRKHQRFDSSMGVKITKKN